MLHALYNHTTRNLLIKELDPKTRQADLRFMGCVNGTSDGSVRFA